MFELRYFLYYFSNGPNITFPDLDLGRRRGRGGTPIKLCCACSGSAAIWKKESIRNRSCNFFHFWSFCVGLFCFILKGTRLDFNNNKNLRSNYPFVTFICLGTPELWDPGVTPVSLSNKSFPLLSYISAPWQTSLSVLPSNSCGLCQSKLCLASNSQWTLIPDLLRDVSLQCPVPLAGGSQKLSLLPLKRQSTHQSVWLAEDLPTSFVHSTEMVL